MVSARGDKKINTSEYNTISDQRKSTKAYTSREEELAEDEDDMCWLDNSIKNLHVRMHKN